MAQAVQPLPLQQRRRASVGGSWVSQPAPPNILQAQNKLINDSADRRRWADFTPTPSGPEGSPFIWRIEQSPNGKGSDLDRSTKSIDKVAEAAQANAKAVSAAGQQLFNEAFNPLSLDGVWNPQSQSYVGQLPSVGSSLHGTGRCSPCAWFWKPRGCSHAHECPYCHLCPEGELKNRKKAKVQAIRMGLVEPQGKKPSAPGIGPVVAAPFAASVAGTLNLSAVI
mmetsp:Transcript_49300/g.127146  ORF Transcript_49300/g.127146 Transcript_49300/m.127146 type:complete len:224 (-) Transcript_49300:153-824(-)